VSGWPIVPLGEILAQDSQTEHIVDTENEKFLTIKLYGNGLVERVIGSGKTPKPFAGYRIKSGQFVYSRIDARNGAYGVVPAELDGAVCSKDFPKFDVDEQNADKGYLLRLVQTRDFYRRVQDLSFGATNRQRVKEEEFLRLQIPLPPIEEQRRIAAILDHADALRAKRREALARLDELAQSIFNDMFGDPATNSKGLELVTIGDLLDSAQYGTSEKSGSEGEFAVLRMNNITYQGQMDLTDLKYTDLPDDKVGRFTVRAGDVLFNRTNSAELVGKTAVYRGERPMAYAGYLVRLRVADGNSPEYVSAFLNSRYGKAVLRGMCKSIVGMANINAKEVQSIRIPKAPGLAQAQFEHRVAAVEASKVGHRATLAELDALFASLQSRAFRGEL
jgi:type I restriction enzyme, S subunit